MTTGPEPDEGTRYEITVAGGMGALVRSAFPGFRVEVRPSAATLRVECGPDELADILARIDGLGLEIDFVEARE